MFSAAQSVRRAFELTSPASSTWSPLSGRLLYEARRLARRASSGELVLFLGSGTSRTVDLPGWSELLEQIAISVGLSHAELKQLLSLETTDQAKLLQHRLGSSKLAWLQHTAAPEVVHGGSSPELAQMLGAAELQRLAVELLSSRHYSLTHGLLAGLPHDAAVTTNSDLCYDLACNAATTALTVLPYEAASSERWLLKLHGDVNHPEDIILTYSSTTPYGYEREALSGVVQGLLITRHILFVGFSLTDEAFNSIAASVRRSLQQPQPQPAMPTTPQRYSATIFAEDVVPLPSPSPPSATSFSLDAPKPFGTTLTLSDRPFLAELWPELDPIPMAAGVAAQIGDRARRWRVLDIFLDRVCLEVTRAAEHLLDPKFGGTFTSYDVELRREIALLVDELRTDERCQQASAFLIVHEMLLQLGCTEKHLKKFSDEGSYII